MNVDQHRKLIDTLTAEAHKIHAQLVEELQSEGASLTPEEAVAIKWTGQVRIFGQTVWHEFITPGSWNGITYYRLQAVGHGKLKSRELEDFREDEGHHRDYPITD